MKVILHPGLPKAGSTTIQSHFQVNLAEFREAGVGYVQPHGSGETLITQALDGFDSLRSAVDVTPLSHVLISHESLMEMKQKDAIRLLDGLRTRGAELDVVVVVRPLAAWVVSNEKQRLKSMRGFRPPHASRVDVWIQTWFSPAVRERLDSPVGIVDLRDPKGLLAEFVSVARLPISHAAARIGDVANSSPSRVELAILCMLNEAIAVAVESSAGGSEILETPRYREVRKFLRLLVGSGDHHRRPINLDMEEDLRNGLLRHFITDLQALLTEEVGKEDEATISEVDSLLKDAKTVVRDPAVSQEIVDFWNDRFLEAASSSIPQTSKRLRKWCNEAGFPEISTLMLED